MWWCRANVVVGGPLGNPGHHRQHGLGPVQGLDQLRIAARDARELVDQGTPIEAACRIVILEDQLEDAQRINDQLRTQGREAQSKTSP
ncbi:hypothetical protein QFZ82_006912 [Streptomyces sp. V4I23]|nr:hypothetical protein [Streptomyces sp. V4I23]